MNVSPEPAGPSKADRKGLIAGIAVAASFGMLALSFAAVPLYRMFCASTGYGGTTQVAEVAPAHQGKRDLIVRFDANVAPGLDWTFEPETPQIKLRTGKTATVYFKVTNLSDHALSAQAMYNVGPSSAGAYFDKISCFCFNEQKLDAHETVEMPVVFFLDPALEQDNSMTDVDVVTLSYTFFAAKPEKAVVIGDGKSGEAGKPL
jgi:cytochrome c oxidase assembly protein subunit 11